MPQALNEVYSFEEMKRKWEGDNPNEPYIRSKTVPEWYGLDNWIVRVDDDGKVISTTAWREYPNFILVGGTKSIEGSQRGHMTDLVSMRNKLIPNKPLVAAFTNAENWMKTNIERGWQIKKYGIDERLLDLIPNDVLGNLNSSYPDGNWGIRETGHIAKSWWFIIKGY